LAGINQKWHGGGTDTGTDEGKLYLDSVLDMGSRRILGFALGEHHVAELAYGALSTPRTRSGPLAGGCPSASRWAAPGQPWTTRSSSPGTPHAGVRGAAPGAPLRGGLRPAL